MLRSRRSLTLASTLVIAGVVLVAAVAGLSQSAIAVEGLPRALAPGCASDARAAGSFAMSMDAGGQRRSALVHVPANALGHRAPLLVALHGGGRSGPFMARYSSLAGISSAAGFVAVFPSATGPSSFWNNGPADDTHADDVAFVRRLVRRLQRGHCLDTSRTYAVGVSNGGGLAARLACESSDVFAAVVVVAGGLGHLPPCEPDRPVSVLELHGTDDGSVHYGGDPDDNEAGGVRGWVRRWAHRDRCGWPAYRRTVAKSVLRFDYPRCPRGISVAHIEIIGGEHAWPGAKPPDPGPRAPLSAGWETWRFVRDHRLSTRGFPAERR